MNQLFDNPSIVGLVLQGAAVFMVAALSLVLLRSMPHSPLAPWTAAWVTLFAALALLLEAFREPRAAHVLQPAYMFLEYVFAYLMFAGCREYATGQRLSARDAWAAPVLLAPAVILPPAGHWDFNAFYAFHALLYSYLFFTAWRQMLRADRGGRRGTGVRVLQTALLLLTLLYLAYAPIFGAAALGWIEREPAFLAFSPFYDMLLLTLLGFGIVMVTSGHLMSDLEMARDRLAGVADKDHLTSAFNRHAFHALERDIAGTAVFADIDNLKSINDQFGHAAGDAAIRACASAIRSHIRADDLLFRWGGDEFLVLLLGVEEPTALARLAGVNDELREVPAPGIPGGVTVSMSMGFAGFSSAESLDDVIRVADTAMYGTKRRQG